MTEEWQGAGRETFFDEHQRATVEAAMTRIIPTDDVPGAREAGTIDFLDRYLSGIDFIYAKPDGSGFERLEGKRAEAWRHRIEIIRARYVEGIAELDRLSGLRFERDFVSLEEAEQDRVLRELERPSLGQEEGLQEARSVAAEGPMEPALQQTSAEIDLDFFPLLALHTRQGFYSDPIYGGNRDHVGWHVIGFPGPVSLAEVHSGRYSTLQYFAEGSADGVREGDGGA